MYEITLVLGDWSDDGHGKTHEEHILCSIENIDEYFSSFYKENPDFFVEGDDLLTYKSMTDSYCLRKKSNMENLIEFYNKNDFYKFAEEEENPCTSFEIFEDFLGDTYEVSFYIIQYMFIVSYQYKKETGLDLVYEHTPKIKRINIGGYELFNY